MSELEHEGDELLKAGKDICDQMSIAPALYSIAISLKRIADKLELFMKQPITMSDEEYKNYELGVAAMRRSMMS